MERLKVFRLPSPAMVVACIALAVALSGASYAAIVLPKNSVGTKQLRKNAVTSAKVKNNAITGAKVNEATLGTVPSAATAGSSDALDGLDSSAFAKSYKRTLVVSPVGAAAANGTALKNALASITDASAANPYLVKLEPGTYDLVEETLALKPYVDLEGSGELITTITRRRSSQATIRVAGNSELRFLTVENSGTPSVFGDIAVGINIFGTARLTNVTSRAVGGTALTTGVWIVGASVQMSRVKAFAGGAGGQAAAVDTRSPSDGSTVNSIQIEYSQLQADGGATNIALRSEASLTRVHFSRLTALSGTNATIQSWQSTAGADETRVGASHLHGGPIGGNSAVPVVCAGVYDEAFVFSASICPG